MGQDEDMRRRRKQDELAGLEWVPPVVASALADYGVEVAEP